MINVRNFKGPPTTSKARQTTSEDAWALFISRCCDANKHSNKFNIYIFLNACHEVSCNAVLALALSLYVYLTLEWPPNLKNDSVADLNQNILKNHFVHV